MKIEETHPITPRGSRAVHASMTEDERDALLELSLLTALTGFRRRRDARRRNALDDALRIGAEISDQLRVIQDLAHGFEPLGMSVELTMSAEFQARAFGCLRDEVSRLEERNGMVGGVGKAEWQQWLTLVMAACDEVLPDEANRVSRDHD